MIWRCDLVPQYEAYREEIHAAMDRVLATGRYVLASELEAFEREFAQYIGVDHGIGVANATDGLTLSLMALGVGPGDEVITTPFTAIPTNSAIVDSGATPVFVDVDPETYLLDLEQVAAAVTPRTRAIMPVHIFGNVVDIPRLRSLVGDVPIVEDASQAHGSLLNGVRAGAMGDLSVFSFYPTKNLGCYGDGGMVMTDRADLAERLRLLRMYGMVDKDHIVVHGVNSRLDELQAAILRVKLKYLDEMNASRRRIAARYRSELPADLFVEQGIPAGVETNYHVYPTRFSGDRDALIGRLDAEKVQTNVYYPLPLYLQEANRSLGMERGALPRVEALCERVMALPMYPELADETLDRVIEIIGRAAAASA